MNDYKELVEYLRKMHNVMLHNDSVESSVPEENITDVDAIACKEAADAIEQLVKERDAAVADISLLIINHGNACKICKLEHRYAQTVGILIYYDNPNIRRCLKGQYKNEKRREKMKVNGRIPWEAD